MANYTKPFKDLTNTTPLSRVARQSEISSYVKNIINTSHVDFHQSEAFEVSEVILDNVRDFGAVRGTFVDDPEQLMVTDLVLPLMPNIMHIPVVGEHVAVIEYNEQLYYTGIINRNNSPNVNDRLGTAGFVEPNTVYGKTFKQKPNVRRLAANEGDITVEGRFGNSIKLGSNTKNGAANLRIRAGQDTQYDDVNILAKENINKDASSIYLSTNEPVSIFNPSFPNKRVEGKSIVLNSDKLFFNGKNGDVNIRASKDVIIEGESVIINAKKGQTIKMGDPRAPMLPTVNGQKLFELFTGLMKLLSAVPKISNPATAVQAGKDILKELPNVTKQVKNKEFLNMQVMTADPGFKVPNIPPKKPLPDPDVALAKKKTGVKIKKKPSLGDLKQ